MYRQVHATPAQLGNRRADGRKVKKQIEACDASRTSEDLTMEIERDLIQGLPRQITVSSTDIATAVEEPVNAIIAAIKNIGADSTGQHLTLLTEA